MNRRTLLKSAGLVPATLSLSTSALAAPKSPAGKTFVLVHGAWHNSLHWGRVAQHLSGLGHRVVCVDLPGHGLNAHFPTSYYSGDTAAFLTESALQAQRDVSFDDCAQAVIDVLKSLGTDSRPILVGHSMGGNVITRVGELAPERVGRLAYLCAYCPVRLKKPSLYDALPEAKKEQSNISFSLGDPAALGVFRINPRGDAKYLEALRMNFYQDVAFRDFLPFAFALTPDLPTKLWDAEVAMTRERWGRLPRTYLRCTLDRAVNIALQDLMIRDADEFTPGNPFEQKTLETSHSPFASQPVRLAEMLASLR